MSYFFCVVCIFAGISQNILPVSLSEMVWFIDEWRVKHKPHRKQCHVKFLAHYDNNITFKSLNDFFLNILQCLLSMLRGHGNSGNPTHVVCVLPETFITLLVSMSPDPGDSWWEKFISHKKPYKMHFLAYLTLQGMLIMLNTLCKVEDHENHVRWIYLIIGTVLYMGESQKYARKYPSNFLSL